ncbi:MAG: hypothetical protein RLZZ546_43 [Bacteroidota bacterium]|jgi:23S rRNA (pseudouridine1915-N3)-methyltransferase
MKIAILCIGKTNEKYLKEGIDIFIKRMHHYVSSIEYKELKDCAKTNDINLLKTNESMEFLKYISKDDFVVILDEKGSQFTSSEFATFIEKHQINSTKRMIFVIGGAFGFSEELYERANQKLSLSKLTFSHQMVRLFFAEQLYRAFTIIKGEKYHNE